MTTTDIATAALAEHADAIRALSQQTIKNLIEIGRRLIECKRICGHGNWLPWIEREFGWSEDTAERLMQLATLANQLPHVAEFTLPVSALYLLAAPSTPEAARTEVIKRAEGGEKLPVAEVKRVVDSAKGRKQPNSICHGAVTNGTHRQPRRQSARKGGTVKPEIPAAASQCTHPPEARVDIGADSRSEAERLRMHVDELQAQVRQRDIKIAGLERELKAGAKAPSESPSPASRCSICHEKKRAPQRPVFICDDCVDIYEVREATPPHPLDIPPCLRRAAP